MSEVHLTQSNSLRKSVLLGPESSAVVLVWWHCTKLVSMTGQAAGCTLEQQPLIIFLRQQTGDLPACCAALDTGEEEEYCLVP